MCRAVNFSFGFAFRTIEADDGKFHDGAARIEVIPSLRADNGLYIPWWFRATI
jgi:hypothetical protein